MGEGEPEEDKDVARNRSKVNYILFMPELVLLKGL
jgi:hypothetical protein